MEHAAIKKIIFEQHEVIKHATIISRDIALEKNANYVLTGLRRAGKSTLLYKRARDLTEGGIDWSRIIYINFDDERLLGFTFKDFDDIIETAEEIIEGDHYYFFDEIQNIDGWENFAIRIANQGLKVDITGSNAKMLSKEIGGKLGGRYLIKEIFPYSFSEYLRANSIKEDAITAKEIGQIKGVLSQYFSYGGFPESLNFIDKREYVSNVFQKVLYGDIVIHYKVRNENGLKLMMKKISESIGQELSYTRLQNLISGIGYKISKDVIIDYCSYCKDAYLLFDLENYYTSLADKTSNPKHYFMDNGILNLFTYDKSSSLLENLVAIELYRRGSNHLYYLKGQYVDVDFYSAEEDRLVQVAYSISEQNTLERETSSLINYARGGHPNAKLQIVTYEEEKTLQIDGFKIQVIPLWKFLLSD